jgi:hypothetical protein
MQNMTKSDDLCRTSTLKKFSMNKCLKAMRTGLQSARLLQCNLRKFSERYSSNQQQSGSSKNYEFFSYGDSTPPLSPQAQTTESYFNNTNYELFEWDINKNEQMHSSCNDCPTNILCISNVERAAFENVDYEYEDESIYSRQLIDRKNERLHSTEVTCSNSEPAPLMMISSTLIGDKTRDESPTLVSTPQSSGYSDECFEHTDEEQLVDTADIDDSRVHVCISSYEATFVNDVSVQLADTIRILRDNNEEWLYVRVESTRKQGYVPRAIVLDLKQLLNKLKANAKHPNSSAECLMAF